MEFSIDLNDLFDDLFNENNRLSKLLLNSNQIILLLNKFKYYLKIISNNYLNISDNKIKTELIELEDKLNLIINNNNTNDESLPVQQCKSKVIHSCDWIGCEYKTTRHSRLITHQKYHSNDKQFQCSVNTCQKRFVGKTQLNEHFKKVHCLERNIACSLCSNKFKTNSSLNSHLKTHFAYKPFRCEHVSCMFRCRTKRQLILHSNTHSTGNIENRIECTFDGCSKQFKSSKTLREHLLTHSTNPSFKCDFPQCLHSFRNYNSLNAHKIIHTKHYLRCDWPGCEYQTKRNVSLREHVLIHTGEKNHACHMCEKRCRTAKLLREHVLTHSETPAFKCTHPGCSSAFRYYKSLYNHKFQHSIEKPFACHWPGCDFATVHRYVLKTHKMKHTGDRPHACSLCDMRFRQSHHLKTHMLKHTGDKPHECDWPGCDRKYQSRQALRTHYDKCHKQLTVSMTTTITDV